MQRALSPVHLAPALLLGAALAGCGSDPEPAHIWPIGGTDAVRAMSSSFGPRLQTARDGRYDFHRGIDIPAPLGTPILAIADGKVRLSGRESDDSEINVQLEHCGEGGKCFYSKYIHLAIPLVEVGDEVSQGDTIGYSGLSSDSRFPHLHFEIRDEQPNEEYCVHPLRFLPTPSWLPPSIEILSVDDSDPSQVEVEVEAILPSVAPGLVQVVVTTSNRESGETLEERVFDYDAWNRKYTGPMREHSADNPDLEDIHVEPEVFNAESPVYTIRFQFKSLAGAPRREDLDITARAIDVNGNHAEARAP
jgi:Peptidase family M23